MGRKEKHGRFDLAQDRGERNQLRRLYRELIHDIDTKRDQLAMPDNRQLQETLETATSLFSNVRNTREAALDSELLSKASVVARDQANRLNARFVAYDANEVMKKLLEKFHQGADADEEDAPRSQSRSQASDGRSQVDFALLTHAVLPFTSVVPTMDFLNGPIERKPVQRKERAKRQRIEKNTAVAVEPERLARKDIDTDKETSSRVMQLHARILENPRTPMLPAVIDPHSFTQSVENLFHLAFLVKDGRVSAQRETNSDGNTPSSKRRRSTLADGSDAAHAVVVDATEPPKEAAATQQCVVRFDHTTWESVIRRHNMTHGIVPHRDGKPEHATPLSG